MQPCKDCGRPAQRELCTTCQAKAERDRRVQLTAAVGHVRAPDERGKQESANEITS